MQIYIMHCKSLVERKKHIQDIISKYSFTNVEWVLDDDATELTSEQVAIFSKTLKKQEISLFLKHINAYRHMIANQIQYALIFEDDVILHPDFNHILETYVKSLPEDWDYLFIGDGCNLHAKTIGNNHLYRVQSTRCADSYLINLKSASAIITYFDNLVKINELIEKPIDRIALPVDHWMNLAFQNLNLNIYWAEPTIATQGSQRQIFKSALENKWKFN